MPELGAGNVIGTEFDDEDRVEPDHLLQVHRLLSPGKRPVKPEPPSAVRAVSRSGRRPDRRANGQRSEAGRAHLDDAQPLIRDFHLLPF
jgi:hypothetical protein